MLSDGINYIHVKTFTHFVTGVHKRNCLSKQVMVFVVVNVLIGVLVQQTELPPLSLVYIVCNLHWLSGYPY